MQNETIILSWKMGGYTWNYWLSQYGGETAVILGGLKKICECPKARTKVMGTYEIIGLSSFRRPTSQERRPEVGVTVQVPTALWEEACRQVG